MRHALLYIFVIPFAAGISIQCVRVAHSQPLSPPHSFSLRSLAPPTLSAPRLVATRCTHTALWRKAAATQTLRRDAKRSVHPRATNSPRVSDSDSERPALGRDTSADGRPPGPAMRAYALRARCEPRRVTHCVCDACVRRVHCDCSTVASQENRAPSLRLGLPYRSRPGVATAKSDSGSYPERAVRFMRTNIAQRLRRACTDLAQGLHNRCAWGAQSMCMHCTRVAFVGHSRPQRHAQRAIALLIYSFFAILCDSLLPVRPVR